MSRPQAAASRPRRSTDDLDCTIRHIAARLGRRPAPLPPDLTRALQQAARAIRKHYPIPDRRTADRAGKFFARALFPRPPGRPRSKDVTRALELEAQGLPRARLYVLLGKRTRDQQHALREAMRQRRLRQRRRAQRQATNAPPVTPTNAAGLLVDPAPALPSTA